MRRLLLALALLVTTAGVACSKTDAGSDQRTLTLGEPTGRMEVILKGIGAVRELSDRRLWVNGGKDFGEFVLFDFATKTTATPLRKGQGPGELSGQPWGILAAGGDSSYIRDVTRYGRLFVLDGSIVVSVLQAESPGLRGGGRDIAWADSSGHIGAVGQLKYHVGEYSITKSDSVDVLRYSLSTGAEQMLTRLRVAERRVIAEPQKDNPKFFSHIAWEDPGFSLGEMVAGSVDGWVAVVRLDPYRVDWLRPSGEWIVGKPLAYEASTVTDADKRAYMEALAKTRGDTVLPVSSIRTWPSALPPLVSQWFTALTLTGDGKALIRKPPTGDHPEPRYDIVNRDGKLEGQLALAANETLIGSGPKTLYTFEIDGDGGQWLRRYSWPIR